MQKSSPQLIVALDVETLAEVRELMDRLKGTVDIFTVGSQLFTSCGPAAVKFIEAQGKKVFLDLKYHDIPSTVASAVRSAVGLNVVKGGSSQAIFMFTIHTSGGLDMMKAAVLAATKTAEEAHVKRPLVVGVTVLTSEGKEDNIQALVLEKARLAKAAGLDGVVASCHEAKLLRQEFGYDFVIVTPGIRPSGEDAQDQQRVATPAEAVKSGSNFLVVGRPIVRAADPYQAVKKILEEIRAN